MWFSKGNALKLLLGNVRHFSSSSRARALNLRKINPRVPYQEAVSLAEGLYNVIKERGPLTVTNTWNHAKEAGIGGISSKTHMKLLLKWMRGRNMLKQFCVLHGHSKKFFLTTLPEEPRTDEQKRSMEYDLKTERASTKKKKKQAQ